MKIALLTIATNKYIKFVQPLKDSVRKYFLPGHQVDIFVHTDMEEVPNDCKKIYTIHKPFPYPTLMRFHIFTENKKYYENYDYYYYCDVDMLFVDYVREEIFGDIVAVKHPGFYNVSRNRFAYEKRKISKAYIADNEGYFYYCGGFNGGKYFLKMAKKLAINVQIDLNHGVVAVWHDESHFNRYLIDNSPDRVLDPSYCYPEPPADKMNPNIKIFKPKLLALNKDDRKELRI